ncbi:hypothetical protein ACQ4PT_007088 [Festuca glaucescens]
MAPGAALVGPPVAVAVAVDTEMADATNPKATTPSKPKAKSPSKPKGQVVFPVDDSSDSEMEEAGLYGAETKALPPTGRALSFTSSGDPCVDFFFQVVPGATAATDVASLLSVAWGNDARTARTALRLVCHLRGVRGLGKSDRDGFYAAALWMHANHPLTLAGNLRTFAKFGCFKDLLEIVYRVLHGPRDERKEENQPAPARNGHKRGRGGDGKAATAEAKRRKEVEHAQVTMSRYASDDKFRHLYDCVAELFAEQLKADLEHLRAGDTAKITLAVKWCRRSAPRTTAPPSSARPSRAACSRASPPRSTSAWPTSTTRTASATASAARCRCRCARPWSSRRCT